MKKKVKSVILSSEVKSPQGEGWNTNGAYWMKWLTGHLEWITIFSKEFRPLTISLTDVVRRYFRVEWINDNNINLTLLIEWKMVLPNCELVKNRKVRVNKEVRSEKSTIKVFTKYKGMTNEMKYQYSIDFVWLPNYIDKLINNVFTVSTASQH